MTHFPIIAQPASIPNGMANNDRTVDVDLIFDCRQTGDDIL
jgi:hypothetical protein